MQSSPAVHARRAHAAPMCIARLPCTTEHNIVAYKSHPLAYRKGLFFGEGEVRTVSRGEGWQLEHSGGEEKKKLAIFVQKREGLAFREVERKRKVGLGWIGKREERDLKEGAAVCF